jgi:hypothetical protein
LFLFCFLLRCRWYRITLFCIQLTKRKKTYGNLYFKSTHKRNRNFYYILFYFLKNKINFQKVSWKNWKAFSVYCLSESHHSVISQEVIAVNWQGKAGHTHTQPAWVCGGGRWNLKGALTRFLFDVIVFERARNETNWKELFLLCSPLYTSIR